MQKITDVAALRIAIKELEYKKSIESALLKEQFFATYNRQKVVNIIKETISEVMFSKGLKSGLVNAAIFLGVGLLTKNRYGFVNTCNFIKKSLESVWGVALTNKVSANTNGIKWVFINKLKKIFKKKGSFEQE